MAEILYKAYKFRLYLNEEQAVLLNKNIGCSRFIYNLMLQDKTTYYNECKKNIKLEVSYYKAIEGYEFLKEVDSLALANAKLNLDKAYNNFFSHKSKMPTFHKKGRNDSYTTNNIISKKNKASIYIIDNKINLPKIGLVKLKLSRKIDNGTIKNCTISKKAGKFYISICVQIEPEIIEPISKEKVKQDKVLGLDYSSPKFFVDSNGNSPEIPRFFEKSQNKLAIEQQKLARKQKFSNGYFKQLLKVQKLHEHIANQRKDFLHKLSNQITNDYDVIVFEDIDLRELSNKDNKDKTTGSRLNLGKRTLDNGFGMFRNFCEYKAERKGKIFIKIDKYFPSTKKCNNCGYVNHDITLQTKEWDCPSCHIHNLRDENAALNIKDEGYRLFLSK